MGKTGKVAKTNKKLEEKLGELIVKTYETTGKTLEKVKQRMIVDSINLRPLTI